MDQLSRRVAPFRASAGELAPGLDTTEGRPSQARMILGVRVRHGNAPRRVAGGECICVRLFQGFFPVRHIASMPGHPREL